MCPSRSVLQNSGILFPPDLNAILHRGSGTMRAPRGCLGDMRMKLDELFSVKGKVALVTGGTRGIGFMIAQGFVENGVRTYICSRKKDACEEAQRALAK